MHLVTGALGKSPGVREMGTGYWILMWKRWSVGLTMVEPFLLSDGADALGAPRNWYPCTDKTTDEEIIERHDLSDMTGYFKIIRQ
ncbi:hypothetical protein NYP20_16290 [Pseudomonas sp. N3-W]|uniref:hypothetical protein n=1 Tax=Pseudomonas sp. N3-W TaxID=2975049 RepID=UPI00217D244A|nr:hypothetical protein [Pseudomonas sp. N3-W]UWF46909.1 hypothetical protein NYP20_16290 [Pseudomonas sp. N3-W]